MDLQQAMWSREKMIAFLKERREPVEVVLEEKNIEEEVVEEELIIEEKPKKEKKKRGRKKKEDVEILSLYELSK